MTITINQKSGSYYIYKNLTDKNQDWDYYAVDISGGAAWDAYEAKIYGKDKKEVGYIWLNRRLFRTAQLQIVLTPPDKKPIEIIPKNVWNWKDLIWSFEFNNSKYIFQEHRGHHRSLFKNDNQVAAFDKRTFNFFENDVLNIYANNDEDILLLCCLALYGDIGNFNRGTTASFDFGNLNGTKPPLNGKWRPTKI
ncbi:MAG: hypothetical protein C0448_07815 [Sphingobacteriaceae bacterium]|nr:hypothetical protein [Sphingobacteriaceae bacterium]